MTWLFRISAFIWLSCPSWGIVDERSPSAKVPYGLRDTLGCFVAERPILTLSNRHSVISPLLWCKALRSYLQLNIFFMHISVYEGKYLPCFCQIASLQVRHVGHRWVRPKHGRFLAGFYTEICMSFCYSLKIKRDRSFLPVSAISVFSYICRADHIIISMRWLACVAWLLMLLWSLRDFEWYLIMFPQSHLWTSMKFLPILYCYLCNIVF